MSRKYCLNKKNCEEYLMLPCEWDDCGEIYYKMSEFLQHMKIHIGEVVTRRHLGEEETSKCLWRECEYHSVRTVDDIIRHISFHAFHVKIKCRGANMILKAQVQPCKMDNQCRSLIPELPEQLICGWTYCGITENCPETFYRHVELHAVNFTYVKGEPVKCEWEGCEAILPTKFKLKDHLRTHTQEKLVACPTCGALFSNKTKLLDHFTRQLDNLTECFQCSYCDKKFPAYRLLRDHLRHHVNQFKCPYCDMTCPNQSTVQHHIQYRHSNNRPYICETCQKTFKAVGDLKRHCETHNKDPAFECHVEGCEFVAKTYSAMAKHFVKHQTSENARYLCHVCDMVFKEGHMLTKHLKAKHNFKWPSGHKRFRYKLHEDGYSRLQLVRYESIILTPTADKTGQQQQQQQQQQQHVSMAKQVDTEKNAALPDNEQQLLQQQQQTGAGDLSYNLEMLGDVALSCNIKPPQYTTTAEQYQPMTLPMQIVTPLPENQFDNTNCAEYGSETIHRQNVDPFPCKKVRIFGNEIIFPVPHEQSMGDDYCRSTSVGDNYSPIAVESTQNRPNDIPQVTSQADDETIHRETAASTNKSKKRKRKSILDSNLAISHKSELQTVDDYIVNSGMLSTTETQLTPRTNAVVFAPKTKEGVGSISILYRGRFASKIASESVISSEMRPRHEQRHVGAAVGFRFVVGRR
ncbi:histone H4 transcription factor-like [Tubulanus polymorphus]|uniref:histone H4 transcription factor-like n=1 Tax=Tubulanus polymorphus TaxID=672921 RepID=UPI003DA695A2